MGVLAEVLLGDLELDHQGRVRHRPEQRVERLARLEVERPALHLHDHVAAEAAVERDELVVRLAHAVARHLVAVDEGAPHHDAAVRRDRVGEGVGAVGVRAAVVLGAGLPLGVGLDEEAAEVGDRRVDGVGRGLPPRAHARVERVGRGQAADLARRAEARGQVDAHAVGPQHAGHRGHLGEVRRGERARVGVHVGEHGAVDA